MLRQYGSWPEKWRKDAGVDHKLSCKSLPNRHNDVSDEKNKSWYVVMSICRRNEWKILGTMNQGSSKRESGLLLAPVLMLWGSGHIDHHIRRWVIVPLYLVRSAHIFNAWFIPRLMDFPFKFPCSWTKKYLSISVSDVMWYYASTGREKCKYS